MPMTDARASHRLMAISSFMYILFRTMSFQNNIPVNRTAREPITPKLYPAWYQCDISL
jgi:hypothetical protein